MLNRGQLRPIEYVGLERIGAMADGGYVVDGRLIDSATVILSLGLGYEWTFDEAVRGRNPNAVIIGVDPTIQPSMFTRMYLLSSAKVVLYGLLGRSGKVQKHQRKVNLAQQYARLFRGSIRHIRKMVSAFDGPNDISFPTLVGMVGAVPNLGLVVKMDIEGSEYDVIPSICERQHLVSMLTAEFHDVTTQPDRFNHGIAQLLEHFRIVHIHGNNYAPYSAELDFPDVVEITFIHKELCPPLCQPSTKRYPDALLDVPNNPEKDDYELRFSDADN
jgi:hypothetical protein